MGQATVSSSLEHKFGGAAATSTGNRVVFAPLQATGVGIFDVDSDVAVRVPLALHTRATLHALTTGPPSSRASHTSEIDLPRTDSHILVVVVRSRIESTHILSNRA